MGIPRCNTHHKKVDNDGQDHFYTAQPHQRNSRVIRQCYFRSVSPQLEPTLGPKKKDKDAGKQMPRKNKKDKDAGKKINFGP